MERCEKHNKEKIQVNTPVGWHTASIEICEICEQSESNAIKRDNANILSFLEQADGPW